MPVKIKTKSILSIALAAPILAGCSQAKRNPVPHAYIDLADPVGAAR